MIYLIKLSCNLGVCALEAIRQCLLHSIADRFMLVS